MLPSEIRAKGENRRWGAEAQIKSLREEKEALVRALGKAATDFDEIAEWANKSGLEGVVLHVRGYAEEARAALAAHDKRKGGDDG